MKADIHEFLLMRKIHQTPDDYNDNVAPRTWISGVFYWPDLIEERGRREASVTIAFDTLRDFDDRPVILRMARQSGLCPELIQDTWAKFDALIASKRIRRAA